MSNEPTNNDENSQGIDNAVAINNENSININQDKAFLDANNLKKPLSEYDTEKLWNEVGFHRIIGGTFYGYILLIIGAVVGLATVAIIAEFLPYPQINGYRNMTSTLLGFWFGLLDLNLGGGGGLSDGMNRFIGQYADTNPRRSLEYIRFYIWFQMFTGIAQVTVISSLMFTYFVNSNLAYLTWFILAQSLVQYPGMLMIMQDSLRAFQRGDKQAKLAWLQDTVFQVTVNIVFLILGKMWGESNPAIGELMGITVFYILSQFVDDWINLFIGGKMFADVLKKRGIEGGFWMLLKPQFDKEVVKESIKFTGKQWAGGQITGLIGWIISMNIMVQMPQFSSWSGLLLIPNFLGHLVSMTNWASPTVPAISESYNNGKKELAQYFVHDVLKYYIFVTLWMAVPLSLLAPKILGVVMSMDFISGLGNYQAGLIMIPIIMIRDGLGGWRSLWGKVFVACNKPMPGIYLDWAFTIPGYALQFLFIYLCLDTQILPVWFLLFMPGFINDTIKSVFGYIYLQKTTLQIQYRKIAWQIFIAPLLTAVCYGITLLIFQATVWPLLDLLFIAIAGDIGPLIVAAFILLGVLFIFPALFYAPYYALFGGWDDFTLEEFKKAALLTGPSKFVVMSLYKITAFFYKRSKLSNRFPIADYVIIKRQVQELVAEGKANKLLKK
jgi:hypothetical protein